MKRTKCIFFFGITRFDAQVESTSYTLAKKLAQNGNTVYYIEFPFTLVDILKHWKSPEFKLRKKALSKNNEGIISSGITNLKIIALPTLLSIHFLPEGRLYRRLLDYNERIIGKHLKRIKTDHSIQDIIYINSFVFHYPNLSEYLKPKLSVYHCVDPIFNSYDVKHGLISEKILIDKSDLVICTSPQLYEEKKLVHSSVHLIPNAADINHSIQATDPMLPIHTSLKTIKGPVVGYFGNIESRIDYELVHEVVKLNKTLNFVFAGPMEKNAIPNNFLNNPNVHFTGRIPYHEMPNMLKGFDVAIIPFKKTNESSTIFPLKLFEYLGAAKPVVSTNFNMDLKNFTADLVKYCEDAAQFSSAINEALNSDSDDLRKRRIELASLHTWERRASDFELLIKQSACKSG